MLTIDRF